MASKREERHRMYFKIGALACEHEMHSDAVQHWKTILGTQGYSERSLRQWMRWHRCLGDYVDLAAPLMTEVISALCSGTYTQEVRLMALHDMRDLAESGLSSKQALLHARACLQTAVERQQPSPVSPLDFPAGVERYLDIILIKIVTRIKTYIKEAL